MLSIAARTRIFVAAGATDMRKGFDGLQGVIISVLEQDPLPQYTTTHARRRQRNELVQGRMAFS